ncbi:MAG: OmpA family protein [Gemmatimonadetes bacterium]|nr:OmpA family protein [Gemmatimonadota bacterium]NNM06279.1 OmpA family protein [Gemmatimonadota bacterium]
MLRKLETTKSLLLGTTVVLMGAFSGCSLVKKDELDGQLATMRAEMEAERRAEIAEGDRRLAEELNGQMDGLAARMDGLEEDLAAMASDFDARIEEFAMALRFDVPIYFGFDEDEVTAEYMGFLDRFAEVVNRYYPSSTVTVEGFTDRVGTVEYNKALGERRAKSVMEYLVSRGGLSAERIRAVSYGEAADRLVSADRHGPGPDGWENRRVALVIDHNGA